MDPSDTKNPNVRKKRSLTLAQYVKRRNGVALGGKGALTKMFARSLGASTFAGFWQYWNPIWGYYLGKLVFTPLKAKIPIFLAIILTFTISGFIHDIAIMLVTWKVSYLLTVWFTLMGLFVVLLDKSTISYQQWAWILRAIANFSIVAFCYFLASILVQVIK